MKQSSTKDNKIMLGSNKIVKSLKKESTNGILFNEPGAHLFWTREGM